ncbi:PilZ domain-containing protein [Alkalilimnicola sp. S0819]|uniref:PilZ domain-containing protein n=1 Tax=Alkalilimnicola sp. S0819 TaxID=2613922 RepID=UPI0012623D88|nr:PilZ domain-containing protein [Alkalilimnicola sp. S0819]KAB7619702.1 PilZ domain-containing protein [Alkalilimnicola sp. S0819]MPQ17560.1 hypothetical protein [Alkalilimnicola sp. S0819]
MSAVPGQQRRRHLRVRPLPDEPVWVDVNGEDFVDVLPAVDISEGGVGVRVPHRFEGCGIDAEVALIISLPGATKRSITTHGRIRHVSQAAFGIVFAPLKPADRRAIRDYVHRRAYGGSWWRRLLKQATPESA